MISPHSRASRHDKMILRARLAAALLAASLLAACGGGGGGGSSTPPPPPPPPPPPADTTAPDTAISSQPAVLAVVNSATFTFTATEAGSTFESSLDGAPYAAAISPLTINNLTEGAHTFSVRARDAAGNADATPASFQWTVDTIAPDTQLTVVPAGMMTVNTASFTATSPDTSATFEVSLDGAVFAAAAFPLQLTGLADGPHTFSVRARDAAGNVDDTPATAQWIVDTAAPDTALGATPAAVTNSTTALFSFTSNEAGATFEASVDGAAYATATSPLQFAGLAAGAHTFSVRARDAAGHADSSPATFAWQIDLTPPSGAIVFPTPVSYTDAGTLTVRGFAQDNVSLGHVTVNGVAATSATAFQTWSAVVPIQAGENGLSVTVTDTAGNATTVANPATVFNRGPPIVLNRGIDYDPTGDRIIVSDAQTSSVYGFRISDGLGHLISNTRPPFTAPGDGIAEELVVDAANNRALLVDWGLDMLVSVNLATGARGALSLGSVVPAPTDFSLGFGVAHDPANNRAFVTARGNRSVIAVNLSTGARTVVSSPTVGTGPAMTNPLGIVYDNVSTPGSPRLLVAEAGFAAPAILAVDLATGNRVPFSSSAPIGSGPSFQAPYALRLDAAGARLLVSDALLQSVIGVDIVNGNRTVIAGPGVGAGATLRSPANLALKPSTGQLFVAQNGGEILALNLGTLDRALHVESNLGTGEKFASAGGLIIEQASGAPSSLLIIDGSAQRLTRIHIATGNRTTVSGPPATGQPSIGTGPALNSGVAVVLDRRPAAGGNAALVLLGAPGNAVVSVNLTTGDRTLVANLNAASPAVNQPRKLELDLGANRVYFTDNDNSATDNDALYAIDLGTGVRTTISSPTVGSGQRFAVPTSIVLDPASNATRALVAVSASSTTSPAILEVDLATGNRSIAVPNSAGVGIPFTLPGTLVHDVANSRLLGINLGSPQHVFAASLPFSSRQLISGTNVDLTVRGSGPLQHFAPAMAVDFAAGIAFLVSSDSGAVYAVDLASGDRVYISR